MQIDEAALQSIEAGSRSGLSDRSNQGFCQSGGIASGSD